MHFGGSLRLKKDFAKQVSTTQFIRVTTEVRYIQSHPISKFQYKSVPPLLGKFKFKNKLPISALFNPLTLFELASNVVINLPMPAAFYWTHQGVLKWIEKLGYPQFRNTFYENLINGHSLIFVDAAALSAMNIRNFDDIVKITESIRKLYGVDFLRFVRSVSCPPRYPLPHYGLYRGNTGAKYHDTTNLDLLERMKIIKAPIDYPNHWVVLEKWLRKRQPDEWVRFGAVLRRQLYKVKKAPPPIKKIKDYNYICKQCIPPCTCGWKKMQLAEPWNMRILKDHIISEGDAVSCDLDKFLEVPDNKSKLGACGCEVICMYKWPTKEFIPAKPLSVLSSLNDNQLRKSGTRFKKFVNKVIYSAHAT